MSKKTKEKFEDDKVEYLICVEEFENVFGRKPKDKDEWDNFCHYVKKGLESHIDWGIVYECAKEAIEDGEDWEKNCL